MKVPLCFDETETLDVRSDLRGWSLGIGKAKVVPVFLLAQMLNI